MFINNQNHHDFQKTRFLLAGFHCTWKFIKHAIGQENTTIAVDKVDYNGR